MQNLPFRLLVTDDLDLQNAVRLDHRKLYPPGTVDESDSRSVWTSKLNGSYPQELGLLVLSPQSVTLKALRMTVELGRAPAQIAIFAALSPPVDSKPKRSGSPLDAVSRYLSSVWEPCCKPLVWERCSSGRLNGSRDVSIKTAHVHLTQCSFLKLVVHAPYNKIGNMHRQVVIEDIELRGMTQNLNLVQGPRSPLILEDTDTSLAHPVQFRQPNSNLHTNDMDELQAALLNAGVSMDLVAQVVSFQKSTSEADPVRLSSRHQVGKLQSTNVPVQNVQDAKRVDVLEAPSLSRKDSHSEVLTEDTQCDQPISWFDMILRLHIERAARETALLGDILATRIGNGTNEVSMWQSPTISSSDPMNITEITMYTFGGFFTQCLLCGGSDIQMTCIQMAERYAIVLKESIGAIAAFEGMIAVVALAVRESKASQVYQGAVHLAHTIFMTTALTSTPQYTVVGDKPDTSCEWRDEDMFVADTPPTDISSSLGLLNGVSRCNWSYGLGIVLGSAIASPFCWSAARHTNVNLNSGTRELPTIDKEFLQFTRMLLEQNLTRESFFEELLHVHAQSTKLESAGSGSIPVSRLRLLRLILRNERCRYQIPDNVRKSIRAFCNRYIDERDTTDFHDNSDIKQYDQNTVHTRLAWDCLDELERLSLRPNNGSVTFPKTLLKTVRSKLEESVHPNNYHSQSNHTALWVRDPISSVEAEECAMQMKRYFSTQPRPIALYRHSFVRGCPMDAAKNPTERHEVLQKGNIIFRGQVIPRALPTTTFHEQIKRDTTTFVADTNVLSTKNPNPLAQKAQQRPRQEIVSSLPEFRGPIEQHSNTPKRTGKVVPECIIPSVPLTTSSKPSRDEVLVDPVSQSVPPKNLIQRTIKERTPKELTKERTPRSHNEQTNQVPVAARTVSVKSIKVKSTTDQKPENHDPTRTPKTQVTNKSKATGEANNDAKDHENCSIQ